MARAATSSTEITGLLVRWSSGDPDALDQLVPLVYDECRQIAARQLRGERTDHTLTPTALVHELYIRLVDQTHATWQNRAQFYGIAAQMMRRILVDFARARRAEKRGGSAVFVSLANVSDEADETKIGDVLAIDEALERLAVRDADQVRIIELRFFAGLSVEETAHVLGRSPRTVKREWRLAKAWLYRELGRD
ncbi:MAG TPA: sigma-70 family RNA polymerase sigma factor [Gemmatimonadaceae bacterium]